MARSDLELPSALVGNAGLSQNAGVQHPLGLQEKPGHPLNERRKVFLKANAKRSGRTTEVDTNPEEEYHVGNLGNPR